MAVDAQSVTFLCRIRAIPAWTWLLGTMSAVAAIVLRIPQSGLGAAMSSGLGIILVVLFAGRTAGLVRERDRKANILEARQRELDSAMDPLHEPEDKRARMAHRDARTCLPDRVFFDQRLRAALARPNRSLAVMVIDIDGFKRVNDSLSQTVGDVLRIAIASRLASTLRPGDIVARLDGAEFTVLAEGLDEQSSTRLANRLVRILDEPFDIGGRRVFVRASVGIAVCVGDGPDKDLVRDADAAMYDARRKGGRRYELFSADMHARVPDCLALDCDMRDAALGTEITVNYQPIIDLRDGRICGLEALLRWQHPVRGLISPTAFVPVAEATGFIVPMGLWVLKESCRQVCAWTAKHPSASPLGISVNVSTRQLAAPQFVDDVARTLEETGLDPALLTLEITETMMMDDENDVGECLRQLKKLGLRISVDDFGTGYSSLGHLRRFPIDELKIDRSFVASLGDGSEGSGVASATIRLARSLHIEVVAEGIESDAQLDELRRSSCTRGQGYYFWRPMDADAVDTLLDDVDGSVLPPAALPRVLVVDDDATFRSTVGRILCHAGFDAVEVGTGRAALELASHSRLDAVLLDVGLPDLDGFGVCKALKEAAPAEGLTVLHVTGSAVDLAQRVRGLDGGADGYLTKPVAPEELVATLRSTMRARSEQRP